MDTFKHLYFKTLEKIFSFSLCLPFSLSLSTPQSLFLSRPPPHPLIYFFPGLLHIAQNILLSAPTSLGHLMHISFNNSKMNKANTLKCP